MKTFASAIMSNYRGRLFRLVICNSTWMIRGWWIMLQSIFDGFTAQKILMTGDSDSKEFKTDIIDKYFDVSKIEK